MTDQPNPTGSHDDGVAETREPRWRNAPYWKSDDGVVEDIPDILARLRAENPELEPVTAWDRVKKAVLDQLEDAGWFPELLPLTDDDRGVARAVLYTAADYNTGFSAAPENVVVAWARTLCIAHNVEMCVDYRRSWMTVDLAVRAVHAHFAQSADGRMLPGDIIHTADRIRQGGQAAQ
ncbi:hypothetical protein [Nocardia beijingensis]|uniref:hypothetical protein n=1 Tax=Nocardia beijingensis TaxID=95162 RepID=UPI0033B7FD8D